MNKLQHTQIKTYSNCWTQDICKLLVCGENRTQYCTTEGHPKSLGSASRSCPWTKSPPRIVVQHHSCVPINTYSSPKQKWTATKKKTQTNYFCCCKKFRVNRPLLIYQQWPDSPKADVCSPSRKGSRNHSPMTTSSPVWDSIRHAQWFRSGFCTITNSSVFLFKKKKNSTTTLAKK